MTNTAKLLTTGLSLFLLTGCISAKTTYENGMMIRTAGETNMFRPSPTLFEVSVCVDDPNHHHSISIDGETHVCNGKYEKIGMVYGTQPGALTGIGNTMVQGGAMVGMGYYVGQGLKGSGSSTNVNQEGGGASSGSTSEATGGHAHSYGGNAEANSQMNMNQTTIQNNNPPMGMD